MENITSRVKGTFIRHRSEFLEAVCACARPCPQATILVRDPQGPCCVYWGSDCPGLEDGSLYGGAGVGAGGSGVRVVLGNVELVAGGLRRRRLLD